MIQAAAEAAANVSAVELLVAMALLLVVLIPALYLGFRRTVVRPIRRLAGEVRTVTDDLDHRVSSDAGPRELAELAADIEAMRKRIVDEVGELQQAR